jgi:hypothetical protein
MAGWPSLNLSKPGVCPRAASGSSVCLPPSDAVLVTVAGTATDRQIGDTVVIRKKLRATDFLGA